MPYEPMYVKMARLKATDEPEVTLIVETDGRRTRVYSEKHHGACAEADSGAAALAQIDGEINALWSWAKGRPYTYKYKHTIIETHTVAYPVAGLSSRIIFGIERRPLHAIAYRVMKDMAVRSALALAQLIDSVPDADAALDDGALLSVPLSAAEARRAAFYSTGEFFNKLGLGYENTGDLYYNRMRAVSAAETDGFMRNAEHNADGEIWTLRKVLRRLIWQDRRIAAALYDAAAARWGSRIADPFGFGRMRKI